MRVVVLMEICGERALFAYVFRCTGLLTGVTVLTYALPWGGNSQRNYVGAGFDPWSART